jgi:APA family basic amino acid/polyamine antiporter
LPPVFCKLHPKYRTPYIPTIMTGVVVGAISMVANIDEVVDLTNIGTLFAFLLVCLAIPLLRRSDPDRKRPFRVPLGAYALPVLGAVSCVVLMYYLPAASWWRFAGWLLLGLSVYASYGYVHSVIGAKEGRPSRTPRALQVAALGFLAAAVGMFVIPHESSLVAEFRDLFQAGIKNHARAVWGVGLILVGMAIGIAGSALGLLADAE